LEVRVSAHDDHWQRRVVPLYLVQQPEAVMPRHGDVGDDHIDIAEAGQGLIGRAVAPAVGRAMPPWPGAVPTSTVIPVGGSLYCLRCARPILAEQAEQHEHVTPGAAAAHRRR
jgi:hypothetical protein